MLQHYHSQEDNSKKLLRIKSHEAINKPKRKRITPYQFNILSDIFMGTDTPNYQLRENTAEKLSMTNREVQVWFQNRRAKVNRARQQEQRKTDPFIYPICWAPPSPPAYTPPSSLSPRHYNDHSSQSSVTTTSSSTCSTPTLYPQLLPEMRPIDVLAMAAEYVQRCDEEKRLTEERRRCWRPWD